MGCFDGRTAKGRNKEIDSQPNRTYKMMILNIRDEPNRLGTEGLPIISARPARRKERSLMP